MDTPSELGALLSEIRHVPFTVWMILVFSVFAYGKKWWTDIKQKKLVAASRYWPEQDARVVWAQSIVEEQGRGHSGVKLYVGLLTYSYQGNELEVGEHRVHFASESEADAWARNLRDTRIRIRVNPADSKESVWNADQIHASTDRATQEIRDENATALPLTGWSDTLRLVTLVVGSVAGCVAVWLHLTVVTGVVTGRPSNLAQNQALFWGMHGFAMACTLSSSYLAKCRFPATGYGGGYSFLEDAQKRVLKAVGAYGTVTFILFWLWMAMHPGRFGDPVLAEFSAAWIPLFVGSVMTCQAIGASAGLRSQLASRRTKM